MVGRFHWEDFLFVPTFRTNDAKKPKLVSKPFQYTTGYWFISIIIRYGIDKLNELQKYFGLEVDEKLRNKLWFNGKFFVYLFALNKQLILLGILWIHIAWFKKEYHTFNSNLNAQYLYYSEPLFQSSKLQLRPLFRIIWLLQQQAVCYRFGEEDSWRWGCY